MVVVGGAWIYLQDTTLPAVNDGAINIYIECWIHICTPLMGSVRVVSKALLNRTCTVATAIAVKKIIF